MIEQEADHAAPAPPGPSKGKKRKKVRSVWIAFVGRILAQFVGSAATIGLGLLLLYKYEPSAASAKTGSIVSPAATASLAPQQSAQSHVAATTAPAHEGLSLAVLPLAHFSSAPSHRYVADGITEVITADLAQLRWLRVVSRSSAAYSASQPHSAADIASSLGVRYILEGSVAESNGRLRVTAQLIDATRDEHVWARRYVREGVDLFAAQEEVARAIVRDLTDLLGNDEGDMPLATSGALAR
jgi:TolB-like protein